MESVSQWMSELADRDPYVRDFARAHLVEHKGAEVTRELVAALLDPRVYLRWEAAKALQEIADPIAAPALMHALEDENEDVRWVAGEALIALGKVGQLTVLSGLTRRAGSLDFCKAAHHVLHGSQADMPELAPVRAALEHLDRAIIAPVAAFQALAILSHSTGA